MSYNERAKWNIRSKWYTSVCGQTSFHLDWYRKIDLLFYLGGCTYRQTAVTTNLSWQIQI